MPLVDVRHSRISSCTIRSTNSPFSHNAGGRYCSGALSSTEKCYTAGIPAFWTGQKGVKSPREVTFWPGFRLKGTLLAGRAHK